MVRARREVTSIIEVRGHTVLYGTGINTAPITPSYGVMHQSRHATSQQLVPPKFSLHPRFLAESSKVFKGTFFLPDLMKQNISSYFE